MSADRARTRAEDGAVAVVTAAIVMVLVLVAALAVDLGMQRVARTDMQSLADVVALDLARELDGRRAQEITDLQALADASRSRNQSTLGIPASTSVTPVLGTVDVATGAFTAAAPSTVVTAVKVTATTEVDFSFVGGSGGASRPSIAMANPGACWKIGSTALDLNSGNSVLLDAVLGDALNVSAVSYSGLVGLGLGLGPLATSLSAGTTDELLSTTVGLDTFLTAAVTALTNDGDPSNDGGIAILNAIVNGTSGSIATAPVRVGDLVGLASGDNTALMSTVDLLGLVSGAAFVANGNNFLAIPGLTLTGLPVGATAQLFVTEPPQQACNRGIAETSQVKVVIKVPVSIPISVPVGLGSLDIGLATGFITTTLDLAKASGVLSKVNCEDGAARSLDVALSQVAVASLSQDFDVKLLGLPVISGTVPGTVPVSGASGTYNLELPDKFTNPRKTPAGAGTIGVPSLAGATVSALGIPLLGSGLLRTLAAAVIDPLLVNVQALLVGPVSSILGLRLGGADMFAVRTPQCLNPRLVG